MRMRVAERGDHHSALRIDATDGVIQRRQVGHRPEIRNSSLLYQQISILDGLEMSHLFAL